MATNLRMPESSREAISTTWCRLQALLEEEDLDENERLPSAATLERAIALFSNAASALDGVPMKPTSVSENGRGDVYLYWHRLERVVELIVPDDPDVMPTLLHTERQDVRIDHGISHADLARWLSWLIGE